MPKSACNHRTLQKEALSGRLISPDHGVSPNHPATAPFVAGSEFHDWLVADLNRLEALWPQVPVSGLNRRRSKLATLWPQGADTA